MRVRVLQGFCLGAGVDVHPGDEIELPDHQVPVYLQQGRIAHVPASVPVVDDPAPAAGETAPSPSLPPPGDAPAVTHQDPTPTTRRRGRG